MPTYVYKCRDCEYTFEAQQRFSDAPLTECPQCEDGGVRRVINNVGVVFKGSGFYVTDSRNGKNGSGVETGSEKAESKKNGKGEASETTASETGSKEKKGKS